MPTYGRLDGFTYESWMDDGDGTDPTRCGKVILFVRRTDGRSQMITVLNFWAYFFIQCRADANETLFEEALTDLLDRHFSSQANSRRPAFADVAVKVERVTRINAYNYQSESPMFKISATHPMVIAYLRDSILDGSVLPSMLLDVPTAFEADVEYPHRYALDRDLRVGAWICYDETGEEVDGVSTCTAPSLLYENPDAIRGVPEEEELERKLFAPTCIMSFDIEVVAPPGIFPDAEDAAYPVTQIACVFADLDGSSVDDVLAARRSILLNLGTADVGIVGATFTKITVSDHRHIEAAFAHTGDLLVEFTGEELLLYAYAALVRGRDPDVITGYNTCNFDWKTILNRARNLNLGAEAFCYTRMVGKKAFLRSNKSETRAKGFQEVTQPIMPGRILLDMMQPIKDDHKLREYGLDAVSVHFLGPQHRKDDVKPKQIYDLFYGTEADRGKLGHYCVVDAELPLRLMMHLKTYVAFTEMARVCRVTYDTLIFRGQQAKVYAQLIAEGMCDGYVMPYFKRTGDGNDSRAVGFEGATVVEPIVGFYRMPVVCLDFGALYPSIMREQNLCATTHIPAGTDLAAIGLTTADVEETEIGELFVRDATRPGLMPRILKNLGLSRKAARTALRIAKEGGDTQAAAVYDCRQLALKVSMNSVYGFTGVKTGKMPMNEIAASVTARGRWMIVQTKRIVNEAWEEKYAAAYPGQRPTVVYGDTDSVFVLFPSNLEKDADGNPVDLPAAVAESFAFAQGISASANAFFRAPHDLEVEKCYAPFYSIAKKRYLGRKFDFNPDNPSDIGVGKVSISGLETVRRDNPLMIPTRLTAVINMIVEDKAPERAMEYARETVAAIIHGPCDARAIADAACCAAADSLRCDDATDYASAFYADTYLAQLRALVLPTYDDDQIDAEALSPHDKEREWLAEFPALSTADELAAARDAFSAVLRCNTTFGDYVISQKFSKRPEDYKTAMPHMGVRGRMIARKSNPTDIIAGEWDYRSGDRIPYFIAAPSARYTGVRLADRTEDPVWGRANGVDPDPIKYLERTLGPMVNVLVGLVGDEGKTYRALMRDFMRKSIPARAFTIERFKPEVYKLITGHTHSRRLPKLKVNPQEGAMLSFFAPKVT